MALLLVRTRRRLAAVLATALLSSAILSSSAASAEPAADSKAALAEAEKAVKAKDWPTAARAFDAANKAQPSADSLEGFANALYQGKLLGEAATAYSEWLDKYGAKAAPAKKKTAETRLKELAEKTGAVTIAVNEPGAQIAIDDKTVGTAPLAAPVHLTAGPHHVRVTKDGFITFDQAPNISAGSATTLQATLSPAANKGKLVVKEKTGQAVRVLVDGVDVGPAPWTGEVDAGSHEITARGAGFAALPQKITIDRGKTQEIELIASAQSAAVKIGTSDGKGLIYFDDKLVGEGSFVGDVPAGTHRLKITREGYDPVEEELVVKDKEALSRTITLKLISTITTGKAVETERLEGIYGGFGLIGFFTPGGTGSSMQQDCETTPKQATLVSCDAPSGQGAGLGGFVGYSWNPVGLELYLAGHYDQRTLKNDWTTASTDLGIGPDPARLEEFNLRRAGGMALARVRLSWKPKRIRVDFAAGAGLSYRKLFLERLTTAKDDPRIKDLFVSDTPDYWSPVIVLEPSVAYRLTPGVAVSLGVQMFFETPASFVQEESPKTTRSSSHSLGLRSLRTPAYELASGTQVFIGPVLGMVFGP